MKYAYIVFKQEGSSCAIMGVHATLEAGLNHYAACWVYRCMKPNYWRMDHNISHDIPKYSHSLDHRIRTASFRCGPSFEVIRLEKWRVA